MALRGGPSWVNHRGPHAHREAEVAHEKYAPLCLYSMDSRKTKLSCEIVVTNNRGKVFKKAQAGGLLARGSIPRAYWGMRKVPGGHMGRIPAAYRRPGPPIGRA